MHENKAVEDRRVETIWSWKKKKKKEFELESA